MVTHTNDGYQGLQNSAKAVDTRQEIAKAAGVSHDTIAKVERIERQATPEIKAADLPSTAKFTYAFTM